jgi:hypothetical protein
MRPSRDRCSVQEGSLARAVRQCREMGESTPCHAPRKRGIQ